MPHNKHGHLLKNHWVFLLQRMICVCLSKEKLMISPIFWLVFASNMSYCLSTIIRYPYLVLCVIQGVSSYMYIGNYREKTGKTVKKHKIAFYSEKKKKPIPDILYIVSYRMRIPKLETKFFFGWAQTPFQTDKAITER